MKKVLLFLFIFSSSFLFSQEILLNIVDKPNDDGSALILSWDTSMLKVANIIIERETPDGEFIAITRTEESIGTYEDGGNIKHGIVYTYTTKWSRIHVEDMTDPEQFYAMRQTTKDWST